MQICEICGEQLNHEADSAELTEETAAGATNNSDEILLHVCENCRTMRQ